MQVTLKQSEITAAIARYLTDVLGVVGVSPETLAVTYKQGRSDKNGMTAELEIDAPRYEVKKPEVQKSAEEQVRQLTASISDSSLAAELGNALTSGETAGPVEITSAPSAEVQEPAPVEVVSEAKPSPELTEALDVLANTTPVYDGERRAVEREVEVEPELLPVDDEVAQALAEDAAADLEEAAEEAAPAAENDAAKLFG